MNILLTGGAGYVGSHIAIELLREGHQVVIADNFSNSSPVVVERIKAIYNLEKGAAPLTLYEGDVTDRKFLHKIFKKEDIDCVIHLGGLKSVGESVRKPLEYYRNNLDAILSLLQEMKSEGIKTLIFSSSATVYGTENLPPYTESMRRGSCSNPYGWSKAMVEQILEDEAYADNNLSVCILRYFNPIGADSSGLIGENPTGIPNNLMPYIAQTAIGQREELTIFGNDYETPDGTCRRDYIHVTDLAKGHIKAICFAKENSGVHAFNLGTGQPFSVLEIVKTFEKTNDLKINYKFGERRQGDSPETYADVSKAEEVLGWKTEKNIEDMCRDTWNWQQRNPKGYEQWQKRF